MEITSSKRANKLIADFSDGFAKDWFMPVKECFKRELDIRYTQRVKNKIANYELTQGIYYCFSKGQVIYDSKLAYVDWFKYLETGNYACQIIEDRPDQPIPHQGNDTTENKLKYDGYVKFVLYKIDIYSKKLIAVACYNVSQTEFVVFLKSGVVGNENYCIHSGINQWQLL